MRRILIFLMSAGVVFFGSSISPAQAAPIDPSGNGTIPCTSGSLTVTNFVVTMNATCTGITTIPASVTTITIGVLAQPFALTSITVDSLNPNYSSINGVLFNKLATTLIQYPTGKVSASYIIPASVTVIGPYAFAYATSITSIFIPARVNSIGESAFAYAISLNFITVSSTNPNYTSVDGVLFDKSATTLLQYPVGNSATFYHTPANVTSIGIGAFLSNQSLRKVTLPDSLTSIGHSAFYSANSLTSITIPSGVTHIDEYTFGENTSLAEVTFAPGSKLVTIGEGVFYNAYSLTSITMPSEVTSIGASVFVNNFALTSITIPAKVTSIGQSAFRVASALSSVYFLGNAPLVVGTQAFSQIKSGAKAFKSETATGFQPSGTPPYWNGLTVEVGVHTISYNTKGGSLLDAQGFVGDIAEPNMPMQNGFSFVGWSATDGGSVLSFPYTPDVASNITLFAKWAALSVSAIPPNVLTPTSSTATSKTTSIKLPTFSTSSSKLNNSQKTAIKNLVRKSGQKATFVVTGTARKMPGITDQQVMALARERGQIAMAYLVKLGVAKSKVTIRVTITNQGMAPKTTLLAKY